MYYILRRCQTLSTLVMLVCFKDTWIQGQVGIILFVKGELTWTQDRLEAADHEMTRDCRELNCVLGVLQL